MADVSISDAKNRQPIQDAFEQNDYQYLQELYREPTERYKIPYHNWITTSCSVWPRRFKVS